MNTQKANFGDLVMMPCRQCEGAGYVTVKSWHRDAKGQLQGPIASIVECRNCGGTGAEVRLRGAVVVRG